MGAVDFSLVARIHRKFLLTGLILSVLGQVCFGYGGRGLLYPPKGDSTYNVSGLDGVWETTYDAYDKRNLVTQATVRYPGQPDRQSSFTYDDNGVINHLTNGAGRTIDYQTNANVLITRISGDYGSAGTVSAVYTYDPAYRPDTTTLGNGVITTQVHDPRDLLTSKIATKDGAVIHGNEYGYDEVGRRTFERTIYHQGGGTDSAWVNAYKYDPLYRAMGAKYHVPVASGVDPPAYDQIATFERQQTLDLDLLHNRKSYDDDGAVTTYNENYTPDPLNRIVSLQGPADPAPRTLDYDANGNLTVDQFGRQLAWTPENRLEAVKDAEGNVIAVYLYDATGLRLAKALPDGSRTCYYYQFEEVYLEIGENGPPDREYLIGTSIDHPIAVIQNDAVHYYHQTAQGHVAALSDESGSVLSRYEYDIHGNVTLHSASGANLGIQPSATDQPYYYTGRRLDPETGLYYYRNRYYSADLGRFLSHDPLDYVDGMNLYAYVAGDPVNFTDPMGLTKAKVAKPVANLVKAANRLDKAADAAKNAKRLQKLSKGAAKLAENSKGLRQTQKLARNNVGKVKSKSVAAKPTPKKSDGKRDIAAGESSNVGTESKKLRNSTPSQTERDMVNQGRSGPKKDPALKGFVDDVLEADHIVPLKEIRKMPGFKQLSFKQQQVVANYRRNFIGLTKSANTSKGSKSWAKWWGHKKSKTPVKQSFRTKMLKKERKVRGQLQIMINNLLKTTG